MARCKCYLSLNSPVLEGRVLLAAARVVHWQVTHLTQKDVNTDWQSDIKTSTFLSLPMR